MSNSTQGASPKVSPLLFSAPMIRALLDGRKTQTRRIIKPQPADDMAGVFKRFPHQKGSPYGEAGDLLWVREAWQDYCPLWHGAWCGHGTQEGIQADHQPVYRADDESAWLRGPDGEQGKPLKWKPSIHMPRWASRLTLELTEVRVQRLQEISEADAQDEGADAADPVHENRFYHGYHRVWEGINGKSSWAVNPWVWALSFRVHKQNIDTFLKQRAAP